MKLPPLYEDDIFDINFSVMGIPQPGSFAIVQEEQHSHITNKRRYVNFFIICREVWQWKNRNVRLMVFSHKPDNGAAVAAFIRKIETKMKVRIYSRMGRTKRNNCSWVCISPCWYKSSMARSLFSALLRAGLAYKPNKDKTKGFWTLEFMRALRSCIYLRRTVPAFRRFVNGNTIYNGNQRDLSYGSKYGWDHQFYYSLRLLAPSTRANKLRELLVRRATSK